MNPLVLKCDVGNMADMDIDGVKIGIKFDLLWKGWAII